MELWGQRVTVLELLTRLSLQKGRAASPPAQRTSSVRPACRSPCVLTRMGPCASGFVFSQNPVPSPAKGGKGQEYTLGPPGSLLPSLFSFSALPTEAGPVAQMCLRGWGAASLRGEEEGARQLAEAVPAGERV